MNVVKYLKVGVHKNVSRVFLEGARLAVAFKPGMRYEVVSDAKLQRIILRPTSEAEGKKVSSRKRGSKEYPVIDFRNGLLGEFFGVNRKVRIVIKPEGVVIHLHEQEKRKRRRERSFLEALGAGTPLSLGSLFSGAGILDAALRKGFRDRRVKLESVFSLEKEGRFLDLLMENQEHGEGSIFIEGCIEDVELSRSGMEVSVLAAGIPCVGASVAGKSSNKINHAEQHLHAGALFHWYLRLVEKFNPALLIGENVPGYANTLSYTVIKSVLTSLGYRVSERVLNGVEFGSLENRDRLVFVAVSDGLPEFDFSRVSSLEVKPSQLRDVLDLSSAREKDFRSFDYLKSKELRDKKAGKGFRRQLLTGAESCCGTIRAGYHKGGSTDQFLQHPTNPELSRLFTPLEHAAIKCVPEKLIEGEVATIQHQVLGNGVIFTKFTALASALVDWSMNALKTDNVALAS